MSNHILFRRCHDCDIPTLKQLWALCFTDDAQGDIDAFFERIFPLSVAFAGFDGDMAVTMLYLLPSQACSNTHRFQVWYLYAGGTHPSYRSQGCYRQLMSVAREWAYTSDGVAIYLRPADEGLFRYYASLGYAEPIFTYCGAPTAMIEKGYCLSIDDYLRVRESQMPSSFVLWEPIRPIVNHFIGGGKSAVNNSDGVSQLIDGTIPIEQIPLSSAVISESATALWIPTTDDMTVVDLLKRGISYSLFFGE